MTLCYFNGERKIKWICNSQLTFKVVPYFQLSYLVTIYNNVQSEG